MRRFVAGKGENVQAAQALSQPEIRLRQRPRLLWLRSLLRSPVGLLGAFLVVIVVITAITAPVIAPHDPTKLNLRSRLLPPAWDSEGDPRFLLGTDQLGRDLLSRLIYGSRVSLIVGILGVAVSLVVGVFLGLVSGYFGGATDNVISRFVDTFMAVPFIVLAMAVIGVLGPKGANLVALIVVLGLVNWVTFARVVRGEVLSVKTRDYIEAARCIGQRDAVIILRHVLPNVTASIIVLATLQVATVIIAESSLSFLGLGVQPPTVTWGIMLAEGRDHLATSWWLATFPGIAISLTVLGIILWGDWLRDVLDPRQKT
ncbi:MAG TPA: peptide ABC transporter permease [Chloroflexi bacterium]|nr:peptide ABC transporter permease [Chloroflexota bacterium]